MWKWIKYTGPNTGGKHRGQTVMWKWIKYTGPNTGGKHRGQTVMWKWIKYTGPNSRQTQEVVHLGKRGGKQGDKHTGHSIKMISNSGHK